MAKRKKRTRGYVAHARAMKTPKGYVDPWIVRLFDISTGRYAIFHSWHGSKSAAVSMVRDLNARHSAHIVTRVR